MTEQVIDRKALSELSVEEMLDLQVSQVEELQELATVQSFFGGFRVVATSMEPEDGDNKGYFAMKVEVTDVAEIEAANPHNLALPAVGNTFTERYYPGYGTQRLLQVIKHLHGPDATIRQWLEGSDGVEFQAYMKGKAQKNKETKEIRTFNELDVFVFTGPHTPTE